VPSCFANRRKEISDVDLEKLDKDIGGRVEAELIKKKITDPTTSN